MFEYRVCWNASSNISFSGETEWEDWDGFEEHPIEVEDALYLSEGVLPLGLEIALEASGFDWWVELKKNRNVVE